MSFAVTDPTTSSRLTVGEAESPGPGRTRGGVEDSPLKGMTGARASMTSLRPYSYVQAQAQRLANAKGSRDSGYHDIVVGRAAVPVPPVPRLTAKPSSGVGIGQPIVPWSSLNVVPKVSKEAQVQAGSANANGTSKPAFPSLVRKGRIDVTGLHRSSSTEEEDVDEVQPLGPPRHRSRRVGGAGAGEVANANPPSAASTVVPAALPRIRTSSSELRVRAAPFMRAPARVPSVSSTFGSSVAGVTDPTHTPSPHDAPPPSSHTFGGARQLPTRYTLPSLPSGSSSPHSVMTAGMETPTPSPRPQRGGAGGGGGGHVRQGSSLVPFVKRVVQSIEAREAMEMEQQQQFQERVKRRSAGGGTGSPAVRNEGTEMGAEARRELGFKGTMGVGNEDRVAEPLDEEDEDSDIPDELQVILSQSDDTRTSRIGNFPTDAVDDTLSFVPVEEDHAVRSPVSKLPPSPGLPPAAPLPTPSSTPGVIQMQVSPPAPTFLPFLPPSPTPSPTAITSVAALPSVPSAIPTAVAPAPTVSVRRASEDKDNEADVDEPNHTSSSEDDTKQSFDFTGELRRLNESGGAHRRSFVEQLENAFKTPSRLGAEALGFELDGFLTAGAGRERERGPERVKGDGRDGEPDISMMVESLNESLNLLRPQASVTSKPSYGRLDTAFKFGGKPQPLPDKVDTVLSHAVDFGCLLMILSVG